MTVGEGVTVGGGVGADVCVGDGVGTGLGTSTGLDTGLIGVCARVAFGVVVVDGNGGLLKAVPMVGAWATTCCVSGSSVGTGSPLNSLTVVSTPYASAFWSRSVPTRLWGTI